MNDFDLIRPKLRPVEAFPARDGAREMFTIRDPSMVADQEMTLSGPALFILMHFDGTNTLDEVAEKFAGQFGQSVSRGALEEMVEKLDSGLMLEGARFESRMAGLLDAYLRAEVRPGCYGQVLGDGAAVAAYLDEMIPPRDGASEVAAGGRVVGLIAPHLDFPRGYPCYGLAYGALRGRPVPKRVVILGTNHFGRSTSVVATEKAFETPLGVTGVDVDFLERLERRCDYDLRAHQFDHKREHSIELQVICLQHVFGADAFEIVPVLCHDPTGPCGGAARDGRGMHLNDFTAALGEVIADDGSDTLVVAGADMSHVGGQFGDDFSLDEAFLSEVEKGDRAALGHLAAGRPEAFVKCLSDADNATRVCSAGCMFVTASVLSDAKPQVLHYHQAYTEEENICVSCTAVTYVRWS